jgi:hypothetical protein
VQPPKRKHVGRVATADEHKVLVDQAVDRLTFRSTEKDEVGRIRNP